MELAVAESFSALKRSMRAPRPFSYPRALSSSTRPRAPASSVSSELYCRMAIRGRLCLAEARWFQSEESRKAEAAKMSANPSQSRLNIKLLQHCSRRFVEQLGAAQL